MHPRKKGSSMIWNVLVIAILVVIVMFVLIPFFQKSIKTTSPILDIGKQSTDTLKDELKGSGASGPEGEKGTATPDAKKTPQDIFWEYVSIELSTADQVRYVSQQTNPIYDKATPEEKAKIEAYYIRNYLFGTDEEQIERYLWLEDKIGLQKIPLQMKNHIANTMILDKDYQDVAIDITFVILTSEDHSLKGTSSTPEGMPLINTDKSKLLDVADKKSEEYLSKVQAVYTTGRIYLNYLDRNMVGEVSENTLKNAVIEAFGFLNLLKTADILTDDVATELKIAADYCQSTFMPRFAISYPAGYTASAAASAGAEETLYLASKDANDQCGQLADNLRQKILAYRQAPKS